MRGCIKVGVHATGSTKERCGFRSYRRPATTVESPSATSLPRRGQRLAACPQKIHVLGDRGELDRVEQQAGGFGCAVPLVVRGQLNRDRGPGAGFCVCRRQDVAEEVLRLVPLCGWGWGGVGLRVWWWDREGVRSWFIERWSSRDKGPPVPKSGM